MKNFIFLILLVFFAPLPAQQKLKDYKDIMQSNKIYELDAFLRDANPDDPRREVIKPRLILLLKDYIKKAHPADTRVKEFQEKLAMLKRRPSTKITYEEMGEIIRQKQIEKYKQDLANLQNNKNLAVNNTAGNTAAVPGKAGSNSAPVAVNVAGSSKMSSDEAQEYNEMMAVSAEEHKNKTVKILNKLFDNDPSSTDVIVMIQNKSDCNMIMRMEGAGNVKYKLAIAAHGENSIVIDKGDYLFSSLVCGAQYASQKTVQKSIVVSLGNPGK